MRFLERISIMEAGINDVAMLLDRLVMEMTTLYQELPRISRSASNPEGMLSIEAESIRDFIQHVNDAKALLIPPPKERKAEITDKNPKRDKVAMPYEAVMWLAKAIRLEIVFHVDKSLERFLGPDDRKVIFPIAPGWEKFANRVWRDAGVTYEQYKSSSFNAAIIYGSNTSVQQFVHFGNMVRTSPEVASVKWTGLDAQDLLARLEKAQAVWQAKNLTNKDIMINHKDKIIINEDEIGEPGWFWVYLARGYCSDEARSMGHCARTNDHLISLRQVTKRNDNGEPISAQSWATASYDPQKKVIGELKGPANGKPGLDLDDQSQPVLDRNRIVRKAIAALFRWSEVHGFKQSSYRSDIDFRPDDLDDDLFDTLPTDRAGLFAGSMKTWTRTQGDDINSLIKYVAQRQSKGELSMSELGAFSQETLQAIIEDPSLLPSGLINYAKIGPKGFIKAFDNDYDTLMKYAKLATKVKTSSGYRTLKLVTDDVKVFSKAALRQFFDNHSYLEIDSIGAPAYVKAYGQTKEAADRLFKNREENLTDGDITSLEGEALIRMHELAPKKFRIDNFERMLEAKGESFPEGEGQFKLLSAFAKTGGHFKFSSSGQFTKDEMQSLYKDAPEWFTADNYLRNFSTGDMILDEVIKEIDGDITAEVFQELDEGSRAGLVDHMIDYAPFPLVSMFNDGQMYGYQPETKLFIYKEFSSIEYMIGSDESLNSRRSENYVKVLADSMDDMDYDDSNWPWQKPEEFADDILSNDEIACLVAYAKKAYPAEFKEWVAEEGEIETGEEAIRFVRKTNDDDGLITALNFGYESGAKAGKESEMAQSLLNIVQRTRINYSKIPFDLYFFDGEWSPQAKFGCRVQIGFDHNNFAIILKDNTLLEGLVKGIDHDDIDDGFYEHERQRDYSGFEKDVAIDVFYDNMPDSPAKKKMKKIRAAIEAKKKLKEGSLASRLGWATEI